MKKFLMSAMVALLAVLAGCGHDNEERELRRDKEVTPNVPVAEKKASIANEQMTYDKSRKEIKALHNQVQHDMHWDLHHNTWHPQYPIRSAPVFVPDDTAYTTSQIASSTQSQAPPTEIVTQQTSQPFVPPAPVGNKKAVIVGINNYPGCPLQGCVNDATDIANLIHFTEADYQQFNPIDETDAAGIKAWLKTDLSFTSDQIVYLRDADATTTNITQALLWLTADTKPGDVRFFWYSGHGAEFAGSDVSNQPDHQNQVMCPVDFAWDEQHMIQDVQLHKIFATMPNGVIFNWGSDSCHSGDLDKAIPPRNVRYRRYPLPPPANVAANLAAVKLKRGMPHRGIVAGELDVGFLSGCQYDEFSADTQDEAGRPCGAMTHYFLKVLKTQGMWNKPLTTLAADENKILDSMKYGQHPQPEGARKSKGWLQN